jgi:HK97 family phage portal protein
MSGYVMTGAQYRQNGLSVAATPAPMASRPAPSNVTDGRWFGDEVWALSSDGLCAATLDEAAKISAVNFCSGLIAERVGSLSFDVLDGDVPATDFDMAAVLAYAPNSLQTGSEFWASMTYAAVMTGRAYAEPVISGDRVEIWPLPPGSYTDDWRHRSLSVTYVPDTIGEVRTLGPSQLFWFTDLARGGLEPMTPWKMAKNTMDFALALEVQGRTFFREGRKLAGVLSTDYELTEPAYERISKGVSRWKHGGTPILEKGLKYSPAASTNTDSQFVELIAQRTIELARFWRIPLSMISETSAGKSNSEQQAGDYVKYRIRPLARRIEQAITVRLLTVDQRRRYKARINLDSLLRGDSATQVRNGLIIRNMGAGSVNDIRTRILGWPKIAEAWADDPREPLNSNRAADTQTGGETAPHRGVENEDA